MWEVQAYVQTTIKFTLFKHSNQINTQMNGLNICKVDSRGILCQIFTPTGNVKVTSKVRGNHGCHQQLRKGTLIDTRKQNKVVINQSQNISYFKNDIRSCHFPTSHSYSNSLWNVLKIDLGVKHGISCASISCLTH